MGDFAHAQTAATWPTPQPRAYRGDFFNSSLSVLTNARLTPARSRLPSTSSDSTPTSSARRGYLTNNQTTTTIHLDTDGDGYAPARSSSPPTLRAEARVHEDRPPGRPPRRPGTGSRTRCRSRTPGSTRRRRRADRSAAARDDVRPGQPASDVPQTVRGRQPGRVRQREPPGRLPARPAPRAGGGLAGHGQLRRNGQRGPAAGRELVNVGTIGYTAETLNTPGEVDTPARSRRRCGCPTWRSARHTPARLRGRTTTFRLDCEQRRRSRHRAGR